MANTRRIIVSTCSEYGKEVDENEVVSSTAGQKAAGNESRTQVTASGLVERRTDGDPPLCLGCSREIAAAERVMKLRFEWSGPGYRSPLVNDEAFCDPCHEVFIAAWHGVLKTFGYYV